MRIYLIGMPGSGKTTLGKSLATKLHCNFTDLDERIVSREGIPISEIFNSKGEEYFRKAERSVLEDTALENNLIVATGGGAPCFFNNMELINQMGVSVWLQIPLEQLAKRVAPGKDNKQIRPLFANKNNAEILHTLETMWQKRYSFYQQAHITLLPNETRTEKAWAIIENYLHFK